MGMHFYKLKGEIAIFSEKIARAIIQKMKINDVPGINIQLPVLYGFSPSRK